MKNFWTTKIFRRRETSFWRSWNPSWIKRFIFGNTEHLTATKSFSAEEALQRLVSIFQIIHNPTLRRTQIFDHVGLCTMHRACIREQRQRSWFNWTNFQLYINQELNIKYELSYLHRCLDYSGMEKEPTVLPESVHQFWILEWARNFFAGIQKSSIIYWRYWKSIANWSGCF